MKDCNSCTEKCPQAERAHQAALGRMYATNEFVSLQKKIESGELAPVVHGRWVKMRFDDKSTAYNCSECRSTWIWDTRYCPYCGALMDRKDDI